MPGFELSKQLLFVGAFVGCGYALLGMGLVMVYRIDGVINFAHGAIGTFAGYLAYAASSHMHPAFALLLAVLFGVTTGILIDRVGMQRVRGALEGTILTLGIMITFLAIVQLQWGTTPRRIPPITGGGTVSFWGVTTSGDTLLLVIVTMAVTIALYGFLRWTTVGLQMEAAAQDELGAQLSGISPGTMRLLSWAIASGLAGLAGVLLARQLGLLPATLSFLTVVALVPAFIGGLRSFLVTLIGGVLYGAANSYLTAWDNREIHTTLRESLPFLIVLVVLAVGARSLNPLRQQREV